MASSQRSGVVKEGIYDAFRTNGAPTYYDEDHTPWQADILEAGFIFAVCILALAFYAILPGVHGKDRFFMFVWVTCSVFVGGIILITNYGYEWESSTIHTATKYKAGTGKDISANIGLHIGLRGINITLKGDPVHQLNETIDYNEHFGWSSQQGRLGFGPFASEFNQEYRLAQFRGVPLPVLWIAEYFTFDGEGIRWGRFYRAAGLYTKMCLWAALPLWILANILIFVLLRYGAYFSILTGIAMCTANVIKHYLRNPTDLKIPFESTLELQYGISFWLCLGTGIFCILAGFIILLLDLRFPSVIAKFFGIDILQDENILTREGSNVSRTSVQTNSSGGSDLTEIIEIGSDGERVQRLGHRPKGAPGKNGDVKGATGYITGKGSNLDDVFGDNKDGSEWEDYSSCESLPPTDDEEEEAEQEKIKKATQQKRIPRGFIQRFQVQRRQNSTLTKVGGRNSVSPLPGNKQSVNIRQKQMRNHAWKR